MTDNQYYKIESALCRLTVGTMLAFFLIVILSCSNETKPTDNHKGEKMYFDLANFIQKQKEEMKSSHTSCIKVVSVNGVSEEKAISGNELNQELDSFIDADINKPAWSDKYSIDSMEEQGILQKLKYLTNDPKMKTRELTISFSSVNIVSEIFIRREVKSVIADTYNEMHLWPGKGYEINTFQSVALSDTTSLQVKVVCQK